MWCTFDSAISTPWPKLRIDAMPVGDAGNDRGREALERLVEQQAGAGRGARARCDGTILRSPPESWLPPRRGVLAQLGKISYALVDLRSCAGAA
jgi:hypothetical protein